MKIKESTNEMYKLLAPAPNLIITRNVDTKIVSIFQKSGENKYVVCVLNDDNSLVSSILDSIEECETWITSNI